MRREAERARLIVVNHHLFFADLALRGPHPGRVLPDYDAVIFDEAHQLEDIATEFFGMRISRRRLDRLLADTERVLRAAAAGRDERITLERDIFSGEVANAWHALDSALEGLSGAAEMARGRLTAPSLRGPRPISTLPEALELAARRSED